ncbi:uncharacterized protein BXZ73DRAFT_87004 [Epithele typhae]|uniref:uncharacterized protein n=1 Tax=Epithele typhae TaxID=378194 RepID=UPI0020074F84|nr:uncharacterized protein BXZ73DRAFT_87004 [Epithele typhae]KAH9944030.1 hypothetical protein BXZ73DRAFT_87004 [Epithele typhae]
MPPPPIQLFLTTIASQPQLRTRQEYILRVLQVKKVPYISYDLASDEEAKKLWRRKAPRGQYKQQLPGILIGGEFPGAVEFEELDIFLRLKEEWDPLEGDKAILRSVPVGVPGAVSPAQMNPSHKREGEVDAGEQLEDHSLRGINVTEDDLMKLIEELGLDGADADDLVKGLKGDEAPEVPLKEVAAAVKTETAEPATKEEPPAATATEESPVVSAKAEEPAKEEAPAPPESEPVKTEEKTLDVTPPTAAEEKSTSEDSSKA